MAIGGRQVRSSCGGSGDDADAGRAGARAQELVDCCSVSLSVDRDRLRSTPLNQLYCSLGAASAISSLPRFNCTARSNCAVPTSLAAHRGPGSLGALLPTLSLLALSSHFAASTKVLANQPGPLANLHTHSEI